MADTPKITRRTACRVLAAAGGTAPAAIAGCSLPPLELQPDAPTGSGDGAGGAADAAVGVEAGPPTEAGSAACPLNDGPASAIKAGSPMQLNDACGNPYFLIRDANGVYAMSAVCTHHGCTVNPCGTGFFCPCHCAGFDANGNVLYGPPPSPLPHFACSLSGSNVCVDTATTVPQATRLKA